MLWAPQAVSNVVTNLPLVGSTTGGTLVPSNGTTLLDGTVTELISAANNVQDSWGIMVSISETGATSTASEACIDILVGGATDDVLIPALICGNGRELGFGHTYFFPLHIPAGLRIAASLASVRTSINAHVAVALFGGGTPPFRVGRKVTTYGTQANNARGVALTIAASGAAATATQMTASTNEDHFAFLPGFQIAVDASWNAHGYCSIGIGVGAATEHRIGTWMYLKDAGEAVSGPFPCMPVFHDVPSGSRLTILASAAVANESNSDGLIYAVS